MTRRTLYIICALGLVLISPVVLQAQTPSAKISAGFRNYWEQRPPLIHLAFHQPEYATGDTAFFKASLVQRSTLLPVSGPQVMNLRLLDQAKSLTIHTRVLLNDGAGTGYIALPADGKPGIHTLQAFTDEMILNQDTTSFLQLPLIVTGREQYALRPAEHITIRPEGNHFIAGVDNRLVVQSTTPFVGDIVDSDGRAIMTGLTSGKEGWVSFNMSPDAGRKYFLRIDQAMYPLPDAEVDGLSMEVAVDGDQYVLKVNAPKTSTMLGQQVQLIVSSAARPPILSLITIEPATSVPFKLVAEGANRVTLLTGRGEVIAERLLYRAPATHVLTATTQVQPALRAVVPLDIAVTDDQGKVTNGNFSITVYREEMFVDNGGGEAMIRFKLGLQSELGLLANDVPAESVLWNDYLVVHYKESIPWRTIQEGSVFTRRKTKPYYFKARVYYEESKRPIPDAAVVTFYLNRYDVIYGVNVYGGTIEFPLFMNFGDDEVFYKATFDGKILNGVKVVLTSIPDVNPPAWNLKSLNEEDQYGDFAGVRQKVDESYTFYDENQKKEDGETAEDWNVDFSVDLKKIIPFANVTETIREVVPAVKVRQENGKDIIRIFMKETAKFSPDDPVFIIDGVMTDSVAYLLSLDPEKLSRIGVIRSAKSMATYGVIGRGGIVLVESRTGEYAHEVPRSSHMLRITGLQKPMAFRSRERSKDLPGRLPDLRPVLYWNPAVTVKDGKAGIVCHTSDLSGRFKVRIEGFTDKGEFVRADASFDVKFSKP